MRKLKPKPINRWRILLSTILITVVGILAFYLAIGALQNYLSSPDTFFYYRGVVMALLAPIYLIPLILKGLYSFALNSPLPSKIANKVGLFFVYSGIGLIVINIIGSILLTSKIEKDGYIVCKVKLHSVKYAKNRTLCKKNKSDD